MKNSNTSFYLPVDYSLRPNFYCFIVTEVSELISEQIEKAEVGRLFAVIHLNGKQRKVTTGDIVLFDQSMEADIGERILLNKVCKELNLSVKGIKTETAS